MLEVRISANDKRKLVAVGEGVAVYTAEWNGFFVVIMDESTTINFLSDEDAEGLLPEKIIEFATEEDRRIYLEGLISNCGVREAGS